MNVATERAGSLGLAAALLRVTIVWNVVEGVVALSAGVLARSIALVGFGLDSFIEVAAAAVLLWHLAFPDDDERTEARERLAHRFVGATFIALALYVLAEASFTVIAGGEPRASGVGLALALVSLAVMPALGLVKRRNARQLGSPALVGESTETLICSYLSLTLFIGLAANAIAGWWWADPAAALAMVPWIVKEGLEGLRGETHDEACD